MQQYTHIIILVDIFEDKSRVATSFKFKILDSDQKEFLDCYGRVFLWDDESLSLWPLGDSPEEASKYTIKGKDRLEWFVEMELYMRLLRNGKMCINC